MYRHLRTLILALVVTASGCGAPDRPGISLYLALQRDDIDQVERHIYWDTPIDEALIDGRYPLHIAAEAGRIILVRLLLKNGVSIDVPDSAGQTPVDLAILAGRTQVADVLLAKGAALDASQLLLQAAHKGVPDRDILRYLMQQGADLEARDSAGDTALLISIRLGNHRLASHLVRNGASVQVSDARGVSALALAESLQRTDIAHMLRRQGARGP